MPAHVEEDLVGELEEFDHDLGVFSGGLQDVLLGPTVQDQLYRESPVFPTIAFGPRDLHVRDLTDRDRLLGVLLRHLVSLLPRDWQPCPTFVPVAEVSKRAGLLTLLSFPRFGPSGRCALRIGVPRA